MRVKLFVNGELVVSASGEDVPYDHRNLILGGVYGRGWHDHFRGSIDEVEVIHRALSAEEVRQRWSNQRAMTTPWTVSLVSFDSDLEFDTVPRDEISNSPFRTYGEWQYVDGVHGRGVRFDGESGAMRVAADIPEVDVTYSFWIRPEEAVSLGGLQVPVSGYGMFNTNFGLLNPPVSVPVAEPLNLFEVKELAAPESGKLFLHNAQRFWLGQSLQLYHLEEDSWRTVDCGGEVPDKQGGFQLIWEEDGALHKVNPDNGQIHSLDLDTFTWRMNLRLPMIVAGCDVVACSQSGRAFADFDAGQVWWWPKSENKLYPISLEPDLLVPGDEWTGFSMTFGAVSCSSRDAVLLPLVLDDAQHPVSVHEESAREGLLRWFLVAGLGFSILFIQQMKNRRRRMQADPRLSQRTKPSIAYHSTELLEVVERLKQCEKEVVDSATLDVLLGLSNLESEETRRSHRARWIKEINAWSKLENSRTGIVREKDPLDRRRMLYRLHV